MPIIKWQSLLNTNVNYCGVEMNRIWRAIAFVQFSLRNVLHPAFLTDNILQLKVDCFVCNMSVNLADIT